MRRRSVLKGVMSLPLLALLPRVPVARAGAPLRRVRPSDPLWPSEASWQKLSGAVGGNLIRVQPLFAFCEPEPDSVACRDALKNMSNPFYLGEQAAGTQVSGWLDAWTPAASVYAVRAQRTADVVAAVNFARVNNLRLVVKGTGHSYQGTSNAADSLLVWTRAMDQVTLHEDFVPEGCAGKVAPAAAVSAGAGAVWIDLYEAVTTQGGRYVQGGGCADVGVAGLIQSGGFGSFSKGFGSAAAGLLQAEIVTADGRVRTVNPCRDADLFWALKGGGGGSWGVVTRLTLRTHALPQFFGAAWGKISARSDAAFRRLIERGIDFYAERLLNPHWGEQVSIAPGNTFEISMVCQGLESDRAKSDWEPFFAWVQASPGEYTVVDELGAGAKAARGWWRLEGNGSLVPDTRAGAPKFHAWWRGDQAQVGAYLYGYESFWLPAALLEVKRRPHLSEALFAASRHNTVELHFNKGLAGAPGDAITAASDTATNPAAFDAFALAITATGEGPAYPGLKRPPLDLARARQEAHEVTLAGAELRRVVPRGGSYVSESDYFISNWQQAFWGENYSRLRAIKARYDPDGLFFVHHGVGSEGWSADGFTRVAG